MYCLTSYIIYQLVYITIYNYNIVIISISSGVVVVIVIAIVIVIVTVTVIIIIPIIHIIIGPRHGASIHNNNNKLRIAMINKYKQLIQNQHI